MENRQKDLGVFFNGSSRGSVAYESGRWFARGGGESIIGRLPR
jgi:hypothetical protein